MKTICLSKGKEALVDDYWYPILSKWKWYCSTKGYAVRDIGGRKGKEHILMHRYIMMAPTGWEIDHKNQDKADNQEQNLRIVKPEKNYINRKMLSSNKTGYKGVCFDKSRGKYMASISLNKCQHNLGRFDTALEAARAYNEVAKVLHGEYAYLNEL